jgi:transcriptional regulator with XRE-family HTH domain
MPTRIRSRLTIEAERRAREQCARLGGEVRAGRSSKRLTQQQLGERVGLARQSVSRAERGHGAGLTLDAWQRIGLALDRPLVVTLQQATTGDTADAGHLAMQELVLRLGRAASYLRNFELATRPSEPWRSADVGLEDPARRRLILVECWNSIGDVGAAARSSDRKLAEAQALAAARWGDQAGTVGVLWVVRSTARNRALVARYPEVFAARFPGSSAGWVMALAEGAAPPLGAGLVWCDVAATRVFPWRRPRSTPGGDRAGGRRPAR